MDDPRVPEFAPRSRLLRQPENQTQPIGRHRPSHEPYTEPRYEAATVPAGRASAAGKRRRFTAPRRWRPPTGAVRGRRPGRRARRHDHARGPPAAWRFSASASPACSCASAARACAIRSELRLDRRAARARPGLRQPARGGSTWGSRFRAPTHSSHWATATVPTPSGLTPTRPRPAPRLPAPPPPTTMPPTSTMGSPCSRSTSRTRTPAGGAARPTRSMPR
jgi:hypothetical protein